jgi:hypothetical protein
VPVRGVGIDVFQGLSFDERIAFLGRCSGHVPTSAQLARTRRERRAEGDSEKSSARSTGRARSGRAARASRQPSRAGSGLADVTGVVAGTASSSRPGATLLRASSSSTGSLSSTAASSCR